MQTELPLKSIHFPEAIGFWPPSLITFVLIFIAGIGFYSIFIMLLKQHRIKNQQENALKKLSQLELAHHENQDFLQECSKLLRELSINYYGREQVATLQGDDWLTFLASTSGCVDFNQGVGKVFALAPYQKQTPFNRKTLIALVRIWIKSQTYNGKERLRC